MRRRTVTLLLAVGAAGACLVAGFVLFSRGTAAKDREARATARSGEAKMVQVHVFNRDGVLVGPVESPKLELSEQEWRKRLDREQFAILRASGTERPFCGTLLDNKQNGVYTCAGCGLPLFSSDAKFNSGTGWPSFFQPVGEGNVVERPDYSHGMIRIEINCARCDGHLGHVFPDGPPPTGRRYCLNSASLNFTPSTELASLADPAADGVAAAGTTGAKDQPRQAAQATETATAIFAGGCFWCTEAVFEQLDGVLEVVSGYTGGSKETATYEQVCSGRTGHAEAIRISYDPAKISFERLLDVFFDSHDPTQLNRQGADVGTQYRSAIFPVDEQQKQAAEAKIEQLTQAKAFRRPIVTTIEPLTEFYPAEAYHQGYAENNPLQPYIQFNAVPKVCKIREKYTDLVAPE